MTHNALFEAARLTLSRPATRLAALPAAAMLLTAATGGSAVWIALAAVFIALIAVFAARQGGGRRDPDARSRDLSAGDSGSVYAGSDSAHGHHGHHTHHDSGGDSSGSDSGGGDGGGGDGGGD